MNDSLAKQLHDLVKNYKIRIADELIDTIRKVDADMDDLEQDLNKLIEKEIKEI